MSGFREDLKSDQRETTMSRYTEYCERKHRVYANYANQFDASDLASQFVEYFDSGDRIEVTTSYPSGEQWIRRGRVGITSGWKPVFLLMARRNCLGSSDVLGTSDIVTRVIRERRTR